MLKSGVRTMQTLSDHTTIKLLCLFLFHNVMQKLCLNPLCVLVLDAPLLFHASTNLVGERGWHLKFWSQPKLVILSAPRKVWLLRTWSLKEHCVIGVTKSYMINAFSLSLKVQFKYLMSLLHRRMISGYHLLVWGCNDERPLLMVQ
jgi:hypothetical protein